MRGLPVNRARQVCQSSGLMIIERGVSIETLASALRGMDGDLVYDALLAKECQCAAVIGTEDQASKARTDLGVVIPEKAPTVDMSHVTVEPPQFDNDYRFAFRCIHPGITELADIYLTSFRNAEATNYMAHEFTDTETMERYQMVIQKVSGLTPLDKLKRYQEALEELKDKVSVETYEDGKFSYDYLHVDGEGYLMKCSDAPVLTSILSESN